MAFDLSSLGPLIAEVERAGAPILAAALRAAAPIAGAAVPIPFAGPILSMALNSIADAIGGPADDPAALAQKIAADPDAAAKIQAVENTHKDDLQSALDFARLQTDQNAAELGAAPLWAKILFSAWRPAMGWLAGPLLLAYQLAATTRGIAPVPGDIFNVALGVWAGLAGLRTVDKWQGVASPLPVVLAPVKRLLARKK